MTTTKITVEAPVTKTWNVLADGWLYPLWVVGATRMRAVDAGWPARGSCLHHSVGVWPAVLDDTTEVVSCEESRRLVLRARAWPGGEAEVEIVLREVGDGSRTDVTLDERSVAGPMSLVPGPLESTLLEWRNRESLRRLAWITEGR